MKQVVILSVLLLSFSYSSSRSQIIEKGPIHNVAVTFSPIHLLMPMILVNAEARVHPKFGVAAGFGVGSINGYDAYQFGMQGAYYLVGTFEHGMQLLLEAEYVNVNSPDVGGSGIAEQGTGFVAGPMVGYKYIADYGLTINIQAGVGFGVIHGQATDGVRTASSDESRSLPLLNLMLGWSF